MSRAAGILLTVLSAASFGTLAIFGRFAYAAGLDTFTLLALRFGMAAVCMAILLLARRESLPRGRTLWQLIGMGAIGYVAQSFCYLRALEYASAGLVALLLYLYPGFVVLLSLISRGERVTPARGIALALALAGTALTVSPEGGQLPGILLALGAALIYSAYIMVGARVMERVSAVQSSLVIFASAGVVYGALTLLAGPHLPANGNGWMAVAGMAVIATVVPVAAFLAGMKRIGPTDASMLSTFEPAVTVLLAALLLGERLGPIALIGGGLILAAALVLARSQPAPASPAAPPHAG
jgi:drug/metabolite transporter (DMT)-like permease